MIRSALILAMLLPLGGQYAPTRPHSPTAAGCPTLVAWPMDEGSGTAFNDTSGNGNTANISTPATVTWTANAIKSGVTSPFFNGGVGGVTNDSLGSNLNFTGTTPFSIALWVNRGTSTAVTTYIGDLLTPTTFNGWEVTKEAGTNRLMLFLVGTVVSNSLIVTSTDPIPASAVTYLVVTYDGTGPTTGINAVKLYINATISANIAIQNTFTTPPATSPSQRSFGRRVDQTQPYTGPMGYVEIVGCVWDQTKISANFAGGPAIN